MVAMTARSKFSGFELLALIVGAAGSAVFGLGPFLLGGAFGQLFGFPGNDTFVYRLAGAASAGYAVAIIVALFEGNRNGLRLVGFAGLTFNLASLLACALEFLGGNVRPITYLITLASIIVVALLLMLANQLSTLPKPKPDIAQKWVYVLAVGTLLSAVFGLGPLLIPTQFANFFGFKGTDVLLYRQAGAASLGYAVAGILALRSRAWLEIRLPTIMAFVFNGLSFVASVLGFFAGDPIFPIALIGAASLAITIATAIALRSNGQ